MLTLYVKRDFQLLSENNLLKINLKYEQNIRSITKSILLYNSLYDR